MYFRETTRSGTDSSPESPENDFASLDVSVAGSDVTDLVLTARPAATIKGRILLDAGKPPSTWQAWDFTPRITLDDGVTYELKPAEDGTFVIRGLTGQGMEWSGSGHGLYFKSVPRNGEDVTNLPIALSPGATIDNIQVIVTREHTQVTGSARDAAHAKVIDYSVIVFADDRERWTPDSRYVVAAEADARGRFAISGLPAGRYLAAAVDSVLHENLRDPESLERLRSHASPLRLTTGQSVRMTLTLVEQ